MNEILYRHNDLLDFLLGRDTEFLLVESSYSGDRGGPRGSEEALLYRIEKNSYFDSPVSLYGFLRKWKRGSLDRELALVAEDIWENLLVIDLVQSRVYAPYDGGADIFLSSAATRSDLIGRFDEWIAPR